MKILFYFLIILFSTINSSFIYAEQLSGKSIMEKVFYRDDGTDQKSNTHMILIDKKGNQRKRLLTTYTKDYGLLIKSLLEFTSPIDIAGTRFLSWENKDKDDTQYLYLPALGRSRRIVSSQKKIKFVNTDFTYEDMQRRHPIKDTHTLLKKENYKGYSCYVIESIPNAKTSQYSKRISWIDQNSFLAIHIDFYDKRQKKIKEFRVEKLEQKQDIWTAMKVVMQDFKKNHTTIMEIQSIQYNQNLDDNIFTKRYLEE